MQSFSRIELTPNDFFLAQTFNGKNIAHFFRRFIREPIHKHASKRTRTTHTSSITLDEKKTAESKMEKMN